MGMGKASLDLFHAFWDGLDEVQRADLRLRGWRQSSTVDLWP